MYTPPCAGLRRRLERHLGEGLIAARFDADLSRDLGLDENARVLIIGTEGATDPEIYRSIVGRAP